MLSKKFVILRNNQFKSAGSIFSGTRGARPFTTRGSSGTPAPEISVESLAKKDLMDLARAPEIEGIAPVMPIKPVAPLNVTDTAPDAQTTFTWGVEATGAAGSPYDGEGITVAVIDSGIDNSHEAFNGVQLLEKDFTGEGNGDSDPHGHGTHCAGTIFGRPKDGLRFGVAPGVQRALIGKIFSKNGGGDTTQIYEAILWAIAEGANIVSMSIGFDFPGMVRDNIKGGVPEDFATSNALEAYRANLLFFEKLAEMIRLRASFGDSAILVAAAGNESKRHIHPDYEITVAPPAAANGIVSVGAVGQGPAPDKELSIAAFSNTGPIICAPGVGIHSAKAGGGYHSMDGTSMATPHAAGIAALWAQQLKQNTGFINPEILTARLIGQAHRNGFSSGTDPVDIGAGLIRAPME